MNNQIVMGDQMDFLPNNSSLVRGPKYVFAGQRGTPLDLNISHLLKWRTHRYSRVRVISFIIIVSVLLLLEYWEGSASSKSASHERVYGLKWPCRFPKSMGQVMVTVGSSSNALIM